MDVMPACDVLDSPIQEVQPRKKALPNSASRGGWSLDSTKKKCNSKY